MEDSLRTDRKEEFQRFIHRDVRPPTPPSRPHAGPRTQSGAGFTKAPPTYDGGEGATGAGGYHNHRLDTSRGADGVCTEPTDRNPT
jgi:hypothetical protein